MEIEHLIFGIAGAFVVLIVIMWVLADGPPSNRDRR
jgi:hypothetical protein